MILAAGLVAALGGAALWSEEEGMTQDRQETVSADGVAIAYTARGAGDPALVFLHGGLADSGFWRHQLASLAGELRVVALDVAGHGASGTGRRAWTLEAFGEDVRAVVDALGLRRIVLIGNSMGGPIALEAARLMPDRTAAVIGVESLHDASVRQEAAQWEARQEAFRKDFAGTCRAMVDSLFHPGTDPSLVEDVHARMCRTPQDVAVALMGTFVGYDMASAMAAVDAPIFSINGDLYPTNVEANRRYAPGYEVIVLEDTGHYPMLERPDELDAHLRELVARLRE